MDDLIRKLKEVRGAIQGFEYFSPTEKNCNLILFSMQRLDSVTAELSKIKGKENAENERNTP